MDFMNTIHTEYSLEVMNGINFYIDICNKLNIEYYIQNVDIQNINYKINELIHLINEIWNDFIPRIEIVDLQTTKQFVNYILTSSDFNLVEVIKYSINRFDEIISDLEFRDFYSITDYHDFIFINQPLYDKVFVELLEDILKYKHSYFIPDIYQELLYIYQERIDKLDRCLYRILSEINNSNDNLCDKLENLNINF